MEKWPFFKFSTGEWLSGEILYQSSHLQGIFIQLCAYYFHKNGELSVEGAKARIRDITDDDLTTLYAKNIIKIEDKNIVISFLLRQLIELDEYSKKQSNRARKRWEDMPVDKGGIASALQPDSQRINRQNGSNLKKHASALPAQSHRNAIREDKTRVDKSSTTPVKGVVRDTTSASLNPDISAPLWGRLSSWMGIEIQKQPDEQIVYIEAHLVGIKKLQNPEIVKIWNAIKNSDQELFDKTVDKPGWWPIADVRKKFSETPNFVIAAIHSHFTPKPQEENEN